MMTRTTMTTPIEQLLSACSRLKKLDSYEPPLRTHWITRHDSDNIIRIARLMPVMVEALVAARPRIVDYLEEADGQSEGQYAWVLEETLDVIESALAAIENEFKEERK
jgi:hypothetical protein